MSVGSSIEADEFDVVIVGLGPTGLTLAHLLGRRGLRVIALEREPTFYANARAVHTDDECLRIFQAAGVADELAADMVLNSPAQWVFADGSVLAQFVRTEELNGWGSTNFFYQPKLETTLETRLSRYPNVTVARGRELVRFEQLQHDVIVTHAASQGGGYGKVETDATRLDVANQTCRARYLVACDGGRSAVRAQLGIGMTGRNFPNPWLVVDIKVKDGEEALRHLPYFNFYCDPACPTVSCPQPYGHHRFEFMLMPGQTKEYMEDPATIRRFLSQHVDIDKVEVLRSVVYTFNALMAERWRHGRVLLAGDAAHMMPQFMGQGMSSGVRDAYNLAWKLAAVLRGTCGDALLDSYERERKPHVQEMIDASVQMKDFVSQANPAKAFLRNAIVKAILATPKLRNYIRELRFRPPPTYAPGSYLGLPRRRRGSAEGKPIPQPVVRSFVGRRLRFDDVLGDGFALLGYGVEPRDRLTPDDLAVWESLGIRYVTVFALGERPQGYRGVARQTAPGLAEVEDESGVLMRWFKQSGARPGSVAVIRPDKFVFALEPADSLSVVTQQVRQQLAFQAREHQPLSATGRSASVSSARLSDMHQREFHRSVE